MTTDAELDALVKRLRARSLGPKDNAGAAADAITALRQERDRLRDVATAYKDQMREEVLRGNAARAEVEKMQSKLDAAYAESGQLEVDAAEVHAENERLRALLWEARPAVHYFAEVWSSNDGGARILLRNIDAALAGSKHG